MNMVAFLCIGVALAVTEFVLRRQRRPRTFLTLLVIGLAASLVFTVFLRPRHRSADRNRNWVRTEIKHSLGTRTEVVTGHGPGHLTTALEDPGEVPIPPTPPVFIVPEEIDGADPMDLSEPNLSDQERLWSAFPERIAEAIESTIDRITTIAERQVARNQSRFVPTENQEGRKRKTAIVAVDDDTTEEASEPRVPPSPPSRRMPRTLIAVLASMGLLYVGYLFLDANTRGQFTWPLRFACVLAMGGIIAAVLSLA